MMLVAGFVFAQHARADARDALLVSVVAGSTRADACDAEGQDAQSIRNLQPSSLLAPSP